MTKEDQPAMPLQQPQQPHDPGRTEWPTATTNDEDRKVTIPLDRNNRNKARAMAAPRATNADGTPGAYSTIQALRVGAIGVTQTVHEEPPLIGPRKVLLDDISITLLPGTFVAVVGASGAGKTSLLRALSGQAHGQQGAVFYNGLNVQQLRRGFSTTMGYVPQDDIVHKNLTVEAALHYAARLRLPCGTSHGEIIARVRQVLEDVELTDQRQQLISRLSGGQRKRVNIALELLGNPAIFYLDEPTSGLDSGLDLRMTQLLRRLAGRGKTVVLVTHKTSNIDLCDDVCFLAPGGPLAYYGPPARLKAFFHSDNYASIYNLLYEDPERWATLFRKSPDYAQYVEAPRAQPGGTALATEDGSAPWLVEPPCNSAIRQFWVLTRRYLNVMLHDLPTLLILLLQAPIIAILVWPMADHEVQHNVAVNIRPNGPPEDIYAQRVLFIVVASAIWFGIINAACEIVKEDPIYRHERAVNLRVLPYVLSKVTVLGGLLAIQDFILLYIVGNKTSMPAAGLIWPGESGAFVELYLTLLASFVGLMLGLLISALVPNSDRAVSIVPVLLIPQIIFSNVIFELNDNTGRWLSFLMPSRWGAQAAGTITGLQDRFTNHDVYPFYAGDAAHVIGFWGALVVLAAIYFGLTLLAMHRKDFRQ